MWFFFFKQKTAYEMRITDWSSDVCSSDLHCGRDQKERPAQGQPGAKRCETEYEQQDSPDKCTDMQTADRQQMRKTAAPHRLCILLADRSAVSGRQRGRDCSRPPVKLGLNMGREPVAAGSSEERRVGKVCVST